MTQATCQQALEWVIAYIRDCGVEPTVEDNRAALRLVEAALAQADEGDFLPTAMALIPLYFNLSLAAIPPHQPPIVRGSIGYST